MSHTISVQENDQLMPATWRVLSVFLRRSTLTQADLRKHTGLSHPVIVQQVRQLRRAGLISPGKPIGGQPGRPCTPLGFNWDFRRLLAVDVHPSGLTLQAMNLHCEQQGAPRVIPVRNWSCESIREQLAQEIGNALHAPGAPWAGIGIAFPASITPDGHGISVFPAMPDWTLETLGADLADIFGMPVVLENEANALIYALDPNCLANTETVVTVTLRHSSFIRVGVEIEGAFVHGASNCAGGLGHTSIANNPRECRCGRTGCLETLFIAAQEDPALRPQFVQALAESLVGVVSVLNPARMVIQGDQMWKAEDLDSVRDVLNTRCPRCTFEVLQLEDRPYRATEALFGVANKLCRTLLDLRDGKLTEWANHIPAESHTSSTKEAIPV